MPEGALGTLFAEAGSFLIGGNAKNSPYLPSAQNYFGDDVRGYAPAAELFLQDDAVYAPSAKVTGSKNTLVETGGVSAGGDATTADFIIGDNSDLTYNNTAPEPMWSLLENVVNAGVGQSETALGVMERLVMSEAVSVLDEAAAAQAVESPEEAKKEEPLKVSGAGMKLAVAGLIGYGIYKLVS